MKYRLCADTIVSTVTSRRPRLLRAGTVTTTTQSSVNRCA